MIKYLPNLIDINEVNKEIKNNIFKNTTYRVNIVLGLLFIFLVLIFIYFGINNNISDNKMENNSYNSNNSQSEYYDDDPKIYDHEYVEDYAEDYITPVEYSNNAYELALIS
jgi:cell division protein FtsI/penicillin-binding protein 2